MPARAQQAERAVADGGAGERPVEPTPQPAETSPAAEQLRAGGEAGAREIYTPEDFARFAPRSALDMLEEVPGFPIQSEDQARGLGEASGNILINGERLSSKSTSARDQLRRIPADNVIRIEIVDGASLEIPGLSGRVANIIARSGALSGQFEWRPQVSTGPAPLRWGQGEVSLSGARGPVEFTLAIENPAFYGGSDGPNLVTDAQGNIERRFNRQASKLDEPAVSGNFAIDLPGSATANLNLSYDWGIFRSREHEYRLDPTLPLFDERLRTTNDRYGYEIGGNVDFPLGRGRLRLIALEGFKHEDFATQSLLVRQGLSDRGTRFARIGDSGERIGRGEYRWRMWNADWQASGEAAFNRLDNIASLFAFVPVAGDFVQIPFPRGTGGVREDRYEASLSYGRPISEKLSLQLVAAGEYSNISQTGAGALSRTFVRPKGSIAASGALLDGLDVNLKVARSVGQLEFVDFLARVNITDDNTSVGNSRLRPPQTWAFQLEIARNLGVWGSATLTLFNDLIEDYVTIVPLEAGGESSGNIASARRYGVRLNATIRTEPVGLAGGKFDINFAAENSRLPDPVTFTGRRFDKSEPHNLEIDFRHDVPATDWAYGVEFRDTRYAPYFRVAERGLEHAIARFGAIFVENKDVAGLTVQARAGNLFGGDSILRRTVFAGPRDSYAVLFAEDRRRAIGKVFSLKISGNF